MTDDEKLQMLKERKEKLEAKLKELKFAYSKKGRKLQARRDFITGEAVLKAIKDGVLDKGLVLEQLNKSLTRKSDRALFGLPANPEDFNSWLQDQAPGCKL